MVFSFKVAHNPHNLTWTYDQKIRRISLHGMSNKVTENIIWAKSASYEPPSFVLFYSVGVLVDEVLP